MFTLGELAEKMGLEFSGDAQRQLVGLASLDEAGPDQISFLSNSKYLPKLASTRAGAIILQPEFVEHCPVDCMIADNPYLMFARLTQRFDRSPSPAPGVHASAVVSPDAEVHESASVGPQAVVESGAVIGSEVMVGAGVYIGHGSELGAGTRVNPGATLYHDVKIGRHCIIHAQTVLGSDGFGFAPGPEGWEKICQLGGVRIGDRVEIGACTTIDRGALGHTVIEDGVIIDNQVHIAHNCRVGKNTAIAGCTGLAGSAIIGANCTLAGGVGVTGHVEICDNVHFSGMTMVTKSITEPGSYSSGTGMSPTREWRRNVVRFSQLDAISQRLRSLERQQES